MAKTLIRRQRRQSRCRRILIVNDLTLWHEAITARIDQTSDLRVCAKASNEREALKKISRFHPNLVLSEILRPQDLGFIRELHRRYPRLPILVFSFRDEEAYAPRVLEAGARGYLMKNVDADALIAGIRKVLEGFLVLSPAMTAQLYPPQKTH